MTDLPPLMRDQRKVDVDHLRLLSIFHFVLAGFAVIGIGFVLLHYTLFHTVMANPEMWKQQKGGIPPKEFFAVFKWFYVLFGSMSAAAVLLNLLSGLFLRRKKNRTFSLIVAGVDCLAMPFGTALGVFTFVVLLRDSVRELYDANA
jgi:hypothetical protein